MLHQQKLLFKINKYQSFFYFTRALHIYLSVVYLWTKLHESWYGSNQNFQGGSGGYWVVGETESTFITIFCDDRPIIYVNHDFAFLKQKFALILLFTLALFFKAESQEGKKKRASWNQLTTACQLLTLQIIFWGHLSMSRRGQDKNAKIFFSAHN